VDVSASATAEAFNPSGSNTSIGVSCLRPFLVPNCDPVHTVAAGNSEANTNCPLTAGQSNGLGGPIVCPGGAATCYASYFFDPNNNGALVNPGTCVWNSTNHTCSSGGAVGEPWALHDSGGPSTWYELQFTNESGSALRTYIHTCAAETIACDRPLNVKNGQAVGPTDQGVDDLIHASGTGLNQGQDTICSPSGANSSGSVCTSTPFPITGGSNNPYALSGQTFYSPSDSIALAGVYDGHTLSSGNTNTVTIIGFIELFFVDAQGPPNDLVDTVILQLSGCGSVANSGPPVTTTGGSVVPIRLIHQ